MLHGLDVFVVVIHARQPTENHGEELEDVAMLLGLDKSHLGEVVSRQLEVRAARGRSKGGPLLFIQPVVDFCLLPVVFDLDPAH